MSPPGLLPLAISALLVPGAIASPQLPAEPPPSPAAAELSPIAKYREDLRTLSTELPKQHVNPFTRITREAWDRAVAALDAKLPDLTDDQVAREFQKLVVSLSDAHTNLALAPAGGVGPKWFPFGAAEFSDGWWIAAAGPEHMGLLRTRLLALDGTPVEEAVRRLGELIPADNEHWRTYMAGNMLMNRDDLAAAGIAKSPDRLTIRIADADGREREVTVEPIAPGTRLRPFWPDPTDRAVSASRRARTTMYGHELIPAAPKGAGAHGEARPAAMYIWYYACADQKNGPTVGRWATAALETIDLDRPDRVIIDLRQNTGGNSALLDPFINLLAKRRKALPGGVYALIGPRTFSSALLNAEKLKLVAGAVLVGSPTGGSPNHFGEVRHFTLPHSGLKVFYSTKRFGLPPGADAPDTLQPDVVVATSSTAYFAGQDPVLEAALSVKP